METTTVTNRKKTNNDTVESNSDYDETDNNNNNNIRPDDNKYITDEGVKTSVNPFIDKFLKYTESLGLNRSTKTATLIIVLTIIVIVLYVFIVITRGPPWRHQLLLKCQTTTIPYQRLPPQTLLLLKTSQTPS